MLKQYETVFIMTPVLSEDQMKEAVGKFKAILTENGAKLVHEENWGLRKMAYTIQKKSTGFYHLLQFEAPGDLIEKLEVAFKRDERILRFLTVSLEKHALAYNEKRRSGAFKNSSTAQTQAEA
ncbi:MAG: 30S ribosomal protein S6 [Bacteroidetes bacterium]|nr:30S ribosomal protein S6 [Bacteroidota bacterium]